MKIGSYEYKGFAYDVSLTGGDDGWGPHKNCFYVKAGAFGSDYYKEFDAAVADIKEQIDKFVDGVPNSVEELVDVLSGLLVWSGYEECDLDRSAAKVLIESYILADRGRSWQR